MTADDASSLRHRCAITGDNNKFADVTAAAAIGRIASTTSQERLIALAVLKTGQKQKQDEEEEVPVAFHSIFQEAEFFGLESLRDVFRYDCFSEKSTDKVSCHSCTDTRELGLDREAKTFWRAEPVPDLMVRHVCRVPGLGELR
eukprot:GHVU01153131.1.p1 GENE.GHVU01153131.1~~GHVU01153131.1.p1  ORF type:complete len:144 (+),score=18.61 GHVU01153131.1:1613-2044(+)